VCDASERLKHVKQLSVKKLHAKSTKSRTLCPEKQSWLSLRSHTPLGTLLVLNNAWIYDLRGIFWFLLVFTFLRKIVKTVNTRFYVITKVFTFGS